MSVYNKVTLNGTTLIDISGTTATADKIVSGYGAYGANGIWMAGSNTEIADAETALGSDGSVDLDDAITALTTYSNTVTGGSDTTLSAAVTTLTAGYGGGGSGVHKKTYTYTVETSSLNHTIPVDITVSKILFVHYYDPETVYTTAGTTYEGHKIGPALAYVEEYNNSGWTEWRTHATNGTTGYYTYNPGNVFSTPGQIIVGANPKFPVGHTIVIEVFYSD